MHHILFIHSSVNEYLGCFFSPILLSVSFLQLQVTFNITLDVDSNASLGHRLLLKANVSRYAVLGLPQVSSTL